MTIEEILKDRGIIINYKTELEPLTLDNIRAFYSSSPWESDRWLGKELFGDERSSEPDPEKTA